MKKVFSLLICILSLQFINAQETYTVNGETYNLHTEVDGNLSLLWNTIDKEYRYFTKKNGTIMELKNTKKDGDFQKEYKKTLEALTKDAGMDPKNVRFTLGSLASYIESYNSMTDPDFVITEKESNMLSTRLGFFGGITNSVYTPNPTNAKNPFMGAELEIYDEENWTRHSAAITTEYVFESDDYDYSAFEVGLNYRFRLINGKDFRAFINAKLVSFIYSDSERVILKDDGSIFSSESNTEASLEFPIGLGIGLAYRITPNGFLTLHYNDIVAPGINNNDEFPIDFSLGYKFRL